MQTDDLRGYSAKISPRLATRLTSSKRRDEKSLFLPDWKDVMSGENAGVLVGGKRSKLYVTHSFSRGDVGWLVSLGSEEMKVKGWVGQTEHVSMIVYSFENIRDDCLGLAQQMKSKIYDAGGLNKYKWTFWLKFSWHENWTPLWRECKAKISVKEILRLSTKHGRQTWEVDFLEFT